MMFLAYYSLTRWDDRSKISAYYSILGIAYPIFISLITAIVTEQEYSASNYQNMLMVRNRKTIFAAKVVIMIIAGIFSVLISSILFGLGNIMLLHVNIVPFHFYFIAGLMISAESIILYLLHFFLSLRFGRNVSVLIGITEGLVSALFITGLGEGKWPFVPCSWGTRWSQYYLIALTDNFDMEKNCRTALFICVALSIIMIIAFHIWCQIWEGRHISE